jgi:hypothetical protein
MSSPGAGTLQAARRSVACGSVELAPGARALYTADASTYRQVPLGVALPESVDDVLAGGFSCRTQIEHSTERRALHLAEMLDAGPQ